MKRFRWHLVIVAILVAVALTALFAHSVRVRLIWGSSGFVLGLICGVALVLRTQRHRRKKKEALAAGASDRTLGTAQRRQEEQPRRAGLFRHRT